MPIIDTQDARELDSHLQRFFASNPTERPHRLRRLFTEKFDFNPATGKVSLAKAPRNVTLPSDADRIASIEGINVVYVPLEIPGTIRVRKAEAVAAARMIAGQLGDDMLLLMTNEQAGDGASQLHVILPTFVGSTPALRRMVIERDLPRRTTIQQLSNIYHQWREIKDLRLALEKAFDVEAVTKNFFEEYSIAFEFVQGLVKGFPETDEGREAKKLFVQTLFNRLMFIYFLSRKGWLKFDGNPDYLAALWSNYKKSDDAKNFYEQRLKLLFFTGLNNPRSVDLIKENEPLHSLIGNVPFLNGGLFNQDDFDKEPGITISDKAIQAILKDLFERYNFTVMESTPLDQEVAVDPEMLGKVFEELVTGRHESGSYYTPRPVVSFMCREALKGYLQRLEPPIPSEAIDRFVDQHDVSGLNHTSAEAVRGALTEIKVVDPACGSGAYLLGMMHELVELETVLYSEKLLLDSKSLYDLKLRIIEKNVYGADIDQFAVNVAMLRLWLSLTIDYESFPPLPLPNLDFKIVRGDSLLGPDPNPDNYGTLFRHRVHELSSQLAELKGRHLKATSVEKDSLFDEIEVLQGELTEVLSDEAVPEKVVDWRIKFAEVFDHNGGFDVVIANPPYVVINSNILRTLYKDGIYGRMNTYGLFIQRGLQLTRSGSQLVYINPRTLLADKYFTNLRKVILTQTQLREVVLIEDRHHTFARVLQACILIFLSRVTNPAKQYDVRTRSISVPSELNEPIEPTIISSTRVCLNPTYDYTFLISDKPSLYSVFERMVEHQRTLADMGLRADTGPIQFDKYAELTQESATAKACRLIWAENVQRFSFRPSKKRAQREWLSERIQQICPPNISGNGILIQRVTANEQHRRIIASHIYATSIKASALYSENHTNFIDCSAVNPEISAFVLTVLNSTAMDAVFRSLNSNTQVSAGEINNLPFPKLPEQDTLNHLENLASELIALGGIDASQSNRKRALILEAKIDEIVNYIYGFSDEEQQLIKEVTVSLSSMYMPHEDDQS